MSTVSLAFALVSVLFMILSYGLFFRNYKTGLGLFSMVLSYFSAAGAYFLRLHKDTNNLTEPIVFISLYMVVLCLVTRTTPAMLLSKKTRPHGFFLVLAFLIIFLIVSRTASNL
jgi:hypothetical protein